MPVRFRSKAGAEVLMLDAEAGRVLAALGREPAPQGVFLPEQIDAALQHFAHQPVEAELPPDEGGDSEVEPALGLRRRAWPLLELLRRAQAEGVPVTWSKP